MAPSDIDLDALATQLSERGVAFGTPNPVNEALGADLRRAIDTVQQQGMGPVGYVVLETTPERPGDLRDIAQDLQIATGLDTVVVRTPRTTAAVSDSLTRAEVESGQFALISEPDYAAGLEAFAAEAGGFSIPWVAAGALIIAVLAAVAIATAFSVAMRSSHKA